MPFGCCCCQLIIEYGVDSSVTLMLDNYDWYILPLVNPDGYQYSHDSVSIQCKYTE